MLMFATAGLTAFCVTQSTPLITTDVKVMIGSQVVTLTAVIGAPGSTPTTPKLSSLAAMTPATRVPCAQVGVFVEVVKLTWFTTFKSGCVASTPLSRT